MHGESQASGGRVERAMSQSAQLSTSRALLALSRTGRCGLLLGSVQPPVRDLVDGQGVGVARVVAHAEGQKCQVGSAVLVEPELKDHAPASGGPGDVGLNASGQPCAIPCLGVTGNEVVGRLAISFDGYPLSECGVSSRGSAVGQVFGVRGVVELYAKTGPVTVTSSAEEIKLTETAFFGLVKVTVTCSGTDKGTVTTAGKDELTEVTVTACKSSNNEVCEEPVTAKADNLPWQTQLEEVSGKVRDKITTNAGNKEVGYTITCHNNRVEECVAASSSTAMTNNAGGFVEATFDASTPEAKCTAAGSKGTVRGTDDIKTVSGETLSFK